MNLSKSILISLSLIFLLISCNESRKNKEIKQDFTAQNKLKYAKGFEIQHFKNYKKLVIKAPYKDSKETYEFILTNSKSSTQLNSIKVPINTIVVTSTTHIPMLELLNVENAIAAIGMATLSGVHNDEIFNSLSSLQNELTEQRKDAFKYAQSSLIISYFNGLKEGIYSGNEMSIPINQEVYTILLKQLNLLYRYGYLFSEVI